MVVNEAKLQQFLEKTVVELGAAASAVLAGIGDKLGLYKAMAGAGPLTAAALAERTHTMPRCIREWLLNQAAGGIVTYDPQTDRFTLPDEQACALADENHMAYVGGAFDVLEAMFRDRDRLMEAFRTGRGMDWGEHSPCLFHGTARFFGPTYRGNLVNAWIPALEGVEERLRRGAKVADVGCGFGISTTLMAQAYPRCQFYGFDLHAPSIEAARRQAAEAGVGDRIRFETAAAQAYPGDNYDLVACFDCLHDMGDPVGCARHVRETLKDDGTWMIVEPFARDRPEENFNALGRLFYAASATVCVPNAVASGRPDTPAAEQALGAQAGEKRIRDVVRRGGFARFRRATETPFNLIFEARP
jgi:2-polyprenyl-3-methyl-5-hydroxy-6-metoxy-1,4-benzoquinol methylase